MGWQWLRPWRRGANISFSASLAAALGPTPDPEQVDVFLTQSLGLSRSTVGQSVLGRDLWLYHLDVGLQEMELDEEELMDTVSSTTNTTTTILFLSLVHGNEPLGLVSLLHTAEQLVILGNRATRNHQFLRGSNPHDPAVLEQQARTTATPPIAVNIRVLFLPLVNIDAYQLNIDLGSACHRTNLSPTCVSDYELKYSTVRDDEEKGVVQNSSNHHFVHTSYNDLACTFASKVNGVDLNRNFPSIYGLEENNNNTNATFLTDAHEDDVERQVDAVDGCSSNYAGSQAFSEPETQAIRQVVMSHNISATLSFHSLNSDSRGRPLLLHPYTAPRDMQDMPLVDRQRFAYVNAAVLQKQRGHGDDLFIAGTAFDAINYTARGSTIDWLYESGLVSLPYVMEAVPPCASKWCSDKSARPVARRAQQYAQTAVDFVRIVTNLNRNPHITDDFVLPSLDKTAAPAAISVPAGWLANLQLWLVALAVLGTLYRQRQRRCCKRCHP